MTEPTDATPAPGSRWTHRNGAPYTVLMIANADTQDGARYPVTVVYQGDNGKVWSRPASDWHRSMTATTPQPTQAQAGAVPTREFLERTLAAMEGVIDVADRKTDEFDALRSCVIDLTLMLFKQGQHSTTQAVAVPLTDEQLLLLRLANSSLFHLFERWNKKEIPHYQLMDEMGQVIEHVIRRTVVAHGIKGSQHG